MNILQPSHDGVATIYDHLRQEAVEEAARNPAGADQVYARLARQVVAVDRILDGLLKSEQQ